MHGFAALVLLAAAAPIGDRFIVAYSTSRDFGNCLLDNGFDGPPDRLQWGVWNPAKKTFTEGTWAGPPCPGCGGGVPMRWVAVTPRSDGAWIVWQPDVGLGLAVYAMRVSEDGKAKDAPIKLTMEAETLTTPAAAALGDGLAFAWRNDLGQVPHGFLRVVSPDAAFLGVAPLGSGFLESLTVLGSPSRDAVLVGWSDGSTTTSRAKVARYACEPVK